jgi:cell division septation protein DedD
MAAFGKREPADAFQVMLQDHGFTAYVAETDVPGSGLHFRVRVGPFGTREEAAEVVADMRNRLPKPLPDFWIAPADR